MSYCRWSSDDFQCDVYVYEDVSGGWTTHVASRRHRAENIIPDVKWVWETPWSEYPQIARDVIAQEFARQHKIHMDSVSAAPLDPIGLSRDGESFNLSTPGETADLLQSLKDEGYLVPQYAIDELREEEG